MAADPRSGYAQGHLWNAPLVLVPLLALGAGCQAKGAPPPAAAVPTVVVARVVQQGAAPWLLDRLFAEPEWLVLRPFRREAEVHWLHGLGDDAETQSQAFALVQQLQH